VNEKDTIHVLYKKFLALYPRRFREQVGESMQQTVYDLCNEQKPGLGRSFLMLSIFTETAIGIVREHVQDFNEGSVMKNILANPSSAAILSFILILPIGLLRLILGSDIEPLIAPIESVLTVDGNRPNALGWTIICGGMLLLPLAFVLNFRPMLKRDRQEGKRNLYTINVIVGVAILALILSTWGSLLLEQIYCLQGVRCD